jgi:hypothetical protein
MCVLLCLLYRSTIHPVMREELPLGRWLQGPISLSSSLRRKNQAVVLSLASTVSSSGESRHVPARTGPAATTSGQDVGVRLVPRRGIGTRNRPPGGGDATTLPGWVVARVVRHGTPSSSVLSHASRHARSSRCLFASPLRQTCVPFSGRRSSFFRNPIQSNEGRNVGRPAQKDAARLGLSSSKGFSSNSAQLNSAASERAMQHLLPERPDGPLPTTRNGHRAAPAPRKGRPEERGGGSKPRWTRKAGRPSSSSASSSLRNEKDRTPPDTVSQSHTLSSVLVQHLLECAIATEVPRIQRSTGTQCHKS